MCVGKRCFVLGLSLCLAWLARADDKEIRITQSQLLQLTAQMQIADTEQQYEFARIALTAAYESYTDILERARRDLRLSVKGRRQRQKIRLWNRSTQAYVDRLGGLYHALDSGAALSIQFSQQNVLLFIGSKPVVIDGPSESANRMVERNIVQAFCRLYDCAAYFLDGGPQVVQHTRQKTPVSGDWLFTGLAKVRYRTSVGLIFEFDSSAKRPAKKKACLRLIVELELLAAELINIDRLGVVVDWDTMAIENRSNAALSRVLLNQQGHFLKLSLPLLGRYKDLLPGLLPWLRREMGIAQTAWEDIVVVQSERLLTR